MAKQRQKKLKKMLLVEDIYESVATLYLKRHFPQFDVLYKTNVQDAVDFIEQNQDIEVAIVDMSLPSGTLDNNSLRLGGLRVIEALRQYCEHTKIFVWTRWPLEEVKASLKKFNAIYIGKYANSEGAFVLCDELSNHLNQ